MEIGVGSLLLHAKATLATTFQWRWFLTLADESAVHSCATVREFHAFPIMYTAKVIKVFQTANIFRQVL